VGDKYARAIAEHADAIPVLIPCCISPDQARALCGRLDGFLFTGSASNIEPRHWNGPADAPGPFDPARDKFSLNLVRLAVALEKPSLF
uniref:gamma-glutamyl-gamma-aminobutyrate hydrolase family protein n=1 Tax=Acinetobacter baumannii TaxID=470 RepID=UPI00148F8B61